MGKYIHFFETLNDLERKYWEDDYVNPWVSYTEENQQIDYARDEEMAKWKKPLTFDILTNGVISWNKYSYSSSYASNSRTIEYSKNYGPWTEITSGSTDNEINVKSGDRIQFRGNNNQYGDYRSIGAGSVAFGWYCYFSCSCNFDVSGNLNSLLNLENNVVNEPVFPYLFYSCTTLINAKNLKLNLDVVPVAGYSHMFSGCTNLITAPNLPAKTLNNYSYEYMFNNCTSLIEMPEIKAETLGQYCCYNMFNNCTSLSKVKDLCAENAAIYCYNRMFYKCTGLKHAPELNLTTLASNCCYQMFSECSSLITTPTLSSEILAENCYYAMFEKCTSLINAPVLPSTNLAQACYEHMFNGCTALVNPPELPATELWSYCYAYMFKNCTSLERIPQLNATVLESRCYYYMFEGCTSITEVNILPATVLKPYCYGYMFTDCSGITTLPQEMLPSVLLNEGCYNGMFSGCRSLDIPNDFTLPATILKLYCYCAMFKGCRSLTKFPKGLSSVETLAESCYNAMFSGCVSLTSLSSELLPITDLKSACYCQMFSGCTGLTSLPTGLLPATTLEQNCYNGMFKGCTELVELPNDLLPATTLAYRCCYEMFCNCENITNAPDLNVASLPQYSYAYMFYGCTNLRYIKCLAKTRESNSTYLWLSNVSPIGIFISDPEAEWTTGSGGIPNGWGTSNSIVLESYNAIFKPDVLEISIRGLSDANYEIINDLSWVTVESDNYGKGVFNLSITVSDVVDDRTGVIQIKNLYDNSIIDINLYQVIPSITIDLNNEWVEATDSNYQYKSDSNYHVPSSSATMYITIKGHNTFKIHAYNSSEYKYDYLVISRLDETPTHTSVVNGTNGNYWSGSNKSGDTLVTFTNIEELSPHVITLTYFKNGSVDQYDDCAYISIDTE